MSVKILIIDDNPAILALIGAALTRAGFNTESCVNGREALTLLKAGKNFDLVVSDESMPEVKGSELAYFMRESDKYRDTPFIIISAEQNDEFFGKLVRGKTVSLYYPKPFEISRLLSLINLLLRQSNKIKI